MARHTASGEVAAESKVGPFGEDLLPGSCAAAPRVFTGHERDAEIERDYMLARYYSSPHGRFLTVDPVRGKAEAPTSWNRYSYVLNNPLRYNDPTGAVVNPATGEPCVYRGPNIGDVRQRARDGFVNGAFLAPRANNRTHQGLDVRAPVGMPLVSVANGTVTATSNSKDAGKLIVIDHGNGVTSRYGHLQDTYVAAGDEVSEGQAIGTAGRTGNVLSTQPSNEDHVHLDIQVDGRNVDPEQYINEPTAQEDPSALKSNNPKGSRSNSRERQTAKETRK